MARLRETKAAGTAEVPKGYLRKRASGTEKIDYNVHTLATKAFAVPKPAKTPKAKKPAAQKKGKKVSATYLTLVKRALKTLLPKAGHAGVSVPGIVKYLYKNYREKSDRRHVRLALVKGVANKSIVQTRQRFRLSAREVKKASKKKTTKKSTGTKRKASTKEGAAKKSTATKKAKTTKKTTAEKESTTKKTATKKKAATKKTATKKAATKKAATKKVATKKPAAKKVSKKTTKPVEGTVEESRGTITEGAGAGKWQYYDNGWHDYYPEASTVVEGVYQEYKINPHIDVRAVKSGHFSYSVDFTQLHQTNVETGTVRNIKRVLV